MAFCSSASRSNTLIKSAWADFAARPCDYQTEDADHSHDQRHQAADQCSFHNGFHVGLLSSGGSTMRRNRQALSQASRQPGTRPGASHPV
jgi:hypothetical protein